MSPKASLCLVLLLLVCLCGCESPDKPKLGISFGVGEAKRFPLEMAYMKERAAELGMEVEGRLNKDEMPPQKQDCFEMIDSGISVLIITPRDGRKAEQIVAYAKKRASRCSAIAGPSLAKISISSSAMICITSGAALRGIYLKKYTKAPSLS